MISAVILTQNSSATLKKCLESTVGLDEVIVLDAHSTDETAQIAGSFPHVKLHKKCFMGFGPMRNHGAELAKNDWILALDSDEVLTEGFIEELHQTELEPRALYDFEFHNFFNGKWIKGCGWSPDRHARLYNKNETRFSDDKVHERLIDEGMVGICLNSPIAHFSYRSIGDFSRKMHYYSDLFAQEYKGKKKSSLAKALCHSTWAFLRSYFLQWGFLSGREGFIISTYQAHVTYYKYLKLAERNQCSSP